MTPHDSVEPTHRRHATTSRNREGDLAAKARKFAACLLLAVGSPVFAADRFALIVTGASGGPPYAEKYMELRTSFVDTLREKFSYPADHVVVLAEDADGSSGRATREEVRAALQGFARRIAKDDLLLVLLIGHGTSDESDAKFNLVGPDLTAEEWAALIRPIAGQVVFVNASSGSFEFLARLAGRGRIVLTATDSAAQQFATVFPEYFVRAFADQAADFDKNGRVSIWEAFRSATAGVARWFEDQNRLATERPLLDDNGDGIGREANGAGTDGRVAEATYLQPDAPIATADAELDALLRRRSEVAARLEGLRARKADVPADQYERDLEALLLELARLDRLIRDR
jgi:hypothetical protein